MTAFKPDDLVYWHFKNGDKELCTVKEVRDDYSMWVIWHKDGFINLMPSCGFTLALDIERTN